MATIFFAWELGGGVGHLMRIFPFAQALVKSGHKVYLAAQNFCAVESIFSGSGIQYLAAPNCQRGAQSYNVPLSFAHILANTGFGDDRTLVGLVSAWRNLFQLTKPDLIVADHSPSALLASTGGPAKVAVMGTGFCVPPNICPFPNLRTRITVSEDVLRHDEKQILSRVNRVLNLWRHPPLKYLYELYSRVNEVFLTTFAELDHYPQRSASIYWGPINAGGSGGNAPKWPDGDGKRIFGYLKPFPNLSIFLGILSDLKQPSLIVADGIDPALSKRFASKMLKFETGHVNIEMASQQCDLAITNGTFSTTTSILMAGKPQLLIPIVLEQGILARRVRDLGAGIIASPKEPGSIYEHMRVLLTGSAHKQAALHLCERFRDFNLTERRTQMLKTLQNLI